MTNDKPQQPQRASLDHINPFIDYIVDDSTDEKLRDLFDFYDADGNGMIQRQELIDVLSLCAHEIGLEVDSYLEQIADAVFSNANLNQFGSITPEALREVLKKRPNLTNELSLAKVVLHKTNNNNTNKQCQATRRGASKFLFDKWESIACWLAAFIPICNKLRWEYISNNLTTTGFFLSINLITVLLIIGRIFTYWNSSVFVIIARCGGQCLNFLCSIIVLLVCRRTISYLRARGYGRYLPLDDNVYFHKLIGVCIVVYSFIHTLGHMINFALIIQNPKPEQPLTTFTYAELLFSLKPGIGWVNGSACLSGWLLLLILLVMSLAHRFSRNWGKFELFYYTHLLYIPFWVLLIIHAPHFWHWFVGPFAVFLIESLVRLKILLVNLTTSGKTEIIKAAPLPSDVIHLTIKRPYGFEYNPGDWIYVLIPQIAKYEWHPFTISSAPEQDGVIWLHIRAVGEWTRSLRSYFENIEHRNHLSRFIKSGYFSLSMEQFSGDLSVFDSTKTLGAQRSGAGPRLATYQQSKSFSKSSLKKSQKKTLAPIPENKPIEMSESSLTTTTPINSCEQASTSSGHDISLSTTMASSSASTSSSGLAKANIGLPNLTIFIDGPYGSPSNQIFRAEHAVLIATGIGVTPFASILQSFVKNYEKRLQKCPSCAHEFHDPRPPNGYKLRKVDFVWINRDQKSFEWFIKLLAELELTQSMLPAGERFLDIHIHLTAMEPAKTKSIGLQLALYLVHEKNKKDLVTGLRTRTRAGRPNWDEFFSDIQEQKKGKVSVFFCGRPQLGRMLHRQCDKFGFKFRKEIF